MDQSHLTEARNRLLREFVALFCRDPHVLGLFLGGSVAAGSADAWSDIDLRVLVSHEQHASYVQRRREFPQQIAGFLFNTWQDGAIHCVSHFRDFVKVDVFYLDASTFAPSPWYALPVQALHDPQGLIQDVVERSRPLGFALDGAAIEQSAGKGLAAIHEAYRRLQRGELVFVQSLLDELRQFMTFADDWIHARPPQAVPFSHLETRISPVLLDLLRNSFVSLEPTLLASVLKHLAEHYRGQLAQLADRTGVRVAPHLEAIDLVTNEL